MKTTFKYTFLFAVISLLTAIKYFNGKKLYYYSDHGIIRELIAIVSRETLIITNNKTLQEKNADRISELIDLYCFKRIETASI